MGTVVPERLHLALLVAEEDEILPTDAQHLRLLPAHVLGRERRVPVLAQAERRNLAPPIVGIGGLDEDGHPLALCPACVLAPPHRSARANLPELRQQHNPAAYG